MARTFVSPTWINGADLSPELAEEAVKRAPERAGKDNTKWLKNRMFCVNTRNGKLYAGKDYYIKGRFN